ncbi:MAG: ECF-type sigma factor [Planctomycetota bacterium]
MGEPTSDELTGVLAAAGQGDEGAAEALLPLVYDELRRLAQKKMAREAPGHTLQATALVHEAYLRLLGEGPKDWKSRRQFYAAAAEAMRRILVERARKYRRGRHGGGRHRVPLKEGEIEIECELGSDELVALDEALRRLGDVDRRAYDVVMLHFFGGLEIDQVAEMLGVSPSTVDRDWKAARAWLYDRIAGDAPAEGSGP